MSLHLASLRKRYGDTVAVADVDLTVGEHETLALLGPSGCGKSTLLRLVAGLERPEAGRVVFDGADLTRVPASRRGFGMVFQDYALFPHLDVAGNVGFGLVELGWEASRRTERIVELLALVGLAGLERRRISELSGGQQQRVALARALAPEPRVLLLDEPLSNLDLSLRETLKRELKDLLKRLEVRAIYVTHDQAEAFTMGDRIAVMRDGRLVQRGAALDVVERPADAWVAGFLGYRNVLGPDVLARIPGAPEGASAVLRGDLIGLEAPGEEDTAAVIRDVRRVGLAWELDLHVRAWDVTVSWDGFARDLRATPMAGDEVALRIPPRAWIVLAGEA
jgi:thiamine transport system ATP-binding protein